MAVRRVTTPHDTRAALVSARGLVLVGCGLLLLLGMAVFGLDQRTGTVRSARPVDYNLNVVAAQRLVDREPIYDRTESRSDAIEIAPWMRETNRGPFYSYVGAPPVALLHVPFLAFEHSTAVALFRILAALGMFGAVVVVSRVVSPGYRAAAALAGCGLLLLFAPFAHTLELGQGNEIVMLGLAVSMWATARQRWTTAGIALGLATVVKVTPGLLVLLFVLRGQWRVTRSAVVTMIASCGVSALVGRPAELVTWVRSVLPDVSRGSLYVGNQSLGAWISRMTTGGDISAHALLGPARFVGPVLALGVTLALWWRRRPCPVLPLELGALTLVMLVAGPLSWDHYYVWAVLPLVLLVDPSVWRDRPRAQTAGMLAAIVVAVLLLAAPLSIPSAASVRSDWLLRATSAPDVVAALVLLGVTLVALVASTADEARPTTTNMRSMRTATG
jgi:uncharacterized membrane protein